MHVYILIGQDPEDRKRGENGNRDGRRRLEEVEQISFLVGIAAG